MLGLAAVPQLGHQPEDCQPALARQRGQRAHGRLGRRGDRVEAVDDQDGPAGHVMDLHAPGRAPAHRQRRGHRLDGDPAPQRDGRRGQRVGDLLHAVQRQPDLGLPPRRRQAEPCTQVPVERDVVGPHVGVGAHPIPQHGTRAERRHVSDPWVVEVQDRETRCRQGGHELALGAGHAVEVTQVLARAPCRRWSRRRRRDVRPPPAARCPPHAGPPSRGPPTAQPPAR